MPATTMDQKPGATAPDKPVTATPNPFVRAAREVIEPFGDNSTLLLAASATQVSDIQVPAFGWCRAVIVRVDATGGVGGGATVSTKEDAPWSVFSDLAFTDTNGRPLVGPFTGFDLYLLNKWGGYTFAMDPATFATFTAVAVGAGASGNFTFSLRIPLEVSVRDGLGSLPNQNASSVYRITYTIAAASAVYLVLPATTLPTVRVRFYLESWSPVDPADPRGVPNQQTPPAPGTTQHWSKSTPPVVPGDQRIRMTRVGNMIRTLIFTLRTGAGARTTVDFPDLLRLEWDGKNLAVLHNIILRQYMQERSRLTPDTGVLVVDYTHDLDGFLGQEMRDQWLPTTQATRLELVGTFGASAANLQVLTNDVSPAGNVYIG